MNYLPNTSLNSLDVFFSFQFDEEDEEDDCVSGKKISGNMDVLAAWYKYICKVSEISIKWFSVLIITSGNIALQ